MINKYLDPVWLTRIMSDDIPNFACGVFRDDDILKLRDHAGKINDYIIRDCKGGKGLIHGVKSIRWIVLVSPGTDRGEKGRVNFQMDYIKETKMFRIIKTTDGKIYEIARDINPEWMLQLSRLRLAFGKLFNERLSFFPRLPDG